MSVIGIDFGNESCYVAVAKAGGIETLANDYSLRATPSCVAFAGKRRALGVSAKNQQVTNMKNTFSNFKHLLGRKFSDPVSQEELKQTACRVEQAEEKGVGIRMNYLDQDRVFTPEQCAGMLMTKLKETATTALQMPVSDCVIAVPFYFTNAQRQALLDAAAIGKWHPLRLINETTATALAYGFYKDDLPEADLKPRHVVFVDCGHSALQVSVCAFSKGKLKMIATACDRVGGRDFDHVLAEHFASEFVGKYKVDARKDQRAWVRLLAEVEKMKKQMSANSIRLPLNIECFMNEIDVTSGLQRSEMEEMCAGIFKRIEATMVKCLALSKLSVDDIDSVEIVGGSTRVPMIKQLIEQVFKKQPRTTLNQDEAVSRGAALMCAIMSPAIRVRDFTVVDIQNYPVHVQLEGDDHGAKAQEMEVFPLFHPAHISRELSLYRKGPFNVHVFYADAELPFQDPFIGTWHIKDVKPNAKGEAQEVKIKFKLTPSGTVSVNSVHLVKQPEKKDEPTPAPAPEEEKPAAAAEGQPMEGQEGMMDVNEENTGQSAASPSSETDPGWTQRVKNWFTGDEASKKAAADKAKEGKKTISSVLYELKYDVKTHGYVPKELEKRVAEENQMITNDKNESDRANARNELEETVYAIRNKLGEEEPLAAFVEPATREKMVSDLYAMEDWLYGDGEECEKEQYVQRLQQIRSQFDPIEFRAEQHEKQPAALQELDRLVQSSRDLVGMFRAGDKRYSHLTEADMVNIGEASDKVERFVDEYRPVLQATPKVQDLPKTMAHIGEQHNNLQKVVQSILSRPKPKPPQPAKEETPKAAGEQQQGQGQPEGGENKEQSSTSGKQTSNGGVEAPMDVDFD